MGYKLLSIYLAFLIVITDTNGLSVDINPIPAAVIAGDNLIVTSTITQTESESWKAFTFYIVDGAPSTVCRGAFYSASAPCSDMFGCSYGFDFSCNYTHFNLLLDNVGKTLLGLSIYAEVTITGYPKEISASTTIEVKIPLRGVSLTPNGTLTKTESETQVFQCFARSIPPASLSWYLSGSMLPTSSPPVTTIDTVSSTYNYTAEKDDNGKRLSCTAVYDSTSFTKDVLIIVQYRPTVTVSPNNNPFRVLENATNLLLTCIVTDSNPAVKSFTWTKNGFKISGVVASIYTIPIVNRSHTGSYTCGASNTVGNSEPSTAIQLEILYGIDITTITKQEPSEGTRMAINCSGQSYPEVSDNDVTWTKQNNNAFNMKRKQLVIDNVNRLDSGTYVCSVVIKLIPTVGQPRYVTGRTTVEVDVLYKPTVTVSPDYKQYNVIENTTNFQITCNVTDANPAVTSYRWYKGSSLISNIATYTIPTVLRSHTGSYICDASNAVGSSNISSAVQLNILYGVELNPIHKQIQTEGKQLKITCSGQSNPMMTSNEAKWSKQNNNTFNRGGLQLVIDNVNKLDRGTYKCSVEIKLTPTIGKPINVTGSTTVDIEVLYRPDVAVSPDINPYHVKENTSNLLLTCNVTDANPDVTSYRWYKDGFKVSTAAIYTLSKVNRSHKGSYTCDATNTVGSSDSSSVVELDVLYGVSLQLSGTKINIDESERWDLSCIGDGNPVPNITCVYGYNRTTVGEQQNNVTSIMVDNANCLDTGLYMCSGKNTIGQPVSQSAEVKVACKPRTYNNVEEKNVFINGLDESLNISIKFISYPLSNITWSRELPGGNLTDLDSEFISTISPSKLPYETISTLKKDQLTKDEFGIYLVNASNIHGSFLLKYHVIPKRKPDAPSNITARCGVTSIKVTWISRFNGGENQTFRIHFLNPYLNKTISIGDIADKGENKIIRLKSAPLSPDILYLISLEAENVFGTTNGTDIVNCTTKKNLEDDQPISAALVGGITGSISALLIVIIVIGGLYWWRWRQAPGGDKEMMNRCSNEREEDEEGLKANPLYVTSEEASNVDVGPVYGVVNKDKQKKENITLDENNDQGAAYSQVLKANTQERKKQKEKKESKRPKNAGNCKDIELGTVYEYSDKLLNYKSHDELYANAGKQGNDLNSAKVYSPKKNKDGLIYADLDLKPGPSGKKFVIRGLENTSNYAIIDLSKKAEPLPSDDEDEDKDNGNNNEGNELKG